MNTKQKEAVQGVLAGATGGVIFCVVGFFMFGFFIAGLFAGIHVGLFSWWAWGVEIKEEERRKNENSIK